MGCAIVDDVRNIGNLPDSSKLPDSVLEPHLQSARRLLTKWIGSYSAATGNKKERCIEAEACLTMYYALPILNTFFTQGITTLQKEIGEIEFQFHSPQEMEILRETWKSRATDAVAEWISWGDRHPIGWYAI